MRIDNENKKMYTIFNNNSSRTIHYHFSSTINCYHCICLKSLFSNDLQTFDLFCDGVFDVFGEIMNDIITKFDITRGLLSICVAFPI